MNLIIHLTFDYITFFNENNGNIEFLSNNKSSQPLFFYYDKFSDELKNNAKYKIFCLENKKDFFGNILQNIEQKSQAQIGTKTKNYDYFINFILEKIKDTYEEVKIIFSPNLNENNKTQFESIVKLKYPNVKILSSYAKYSVKNFLLKNQQIESLNSIYVVESISNNITVSKANIVGNEISITQTDTITDTAFEPLRYALAKKITDEIYRIYQPKNKAKNPNDDIEYVYLKIDNFDKIVNQPKEFVALSTRLKNSDERYILKIKPSELKYLADNYAKDLILKIQKNVDEESKLMIVGDYFKDSIITEKLGVLKNDIVYQDSSEILSSIDKQIVEEDEYSTMFLAEYFVETDSDFEQITSLELSQLDIGENIKLNNLDSRPGKGSSVQVLEYVGELKFVVIESTRSLKPGDLIETTEGVWHSGIQIIFTVFRGGQKYGRFQTREIQTIEISKENN